jgi:hypothetical protein
MSQKMIFYGSPSCLMVPPVRDVLERANADNVPVSCGIKKKHWER